MQADRVIEVPRDPLAPGRARAALDDLEGVDPSIVPDAKLLVSELVTNSVKYGGDGPVRLVIHSYDSGRLRCEVVDGGDGFTQRDRASDRPLTDIGGWGLYLVDRLSDDWGVCPAPTHVWFELAPAAEHGGRRAR